MTDPQPLTGDELAAIKARTEAASPAPWARNGLSDVEGSVATFHRVGLAPDVLYAGILTDTQADAEFIAHAREDVPRLVDEVERLRGFLAEANRQYDDQVEKRTEEMNRADAAEAEVERLRARRADLLDFAASVEKTGDPIWPYEVREFILDRYEM